MDDLSRPSPQWVTISSQLRTFSTPWSTRIHVGHKPRSSLITSLKRPKTVSPKSFVLHFKNISNYFEAEKNMDLWQNIFVTMGKKQYLPAVRRCRGKHVCLMSASFPNRNLQNKSASPEVKGKKADVSSVWRRANARNVNFFTLYGG